MMLFNYLYCFVCFTFHFKIVISFSLSEESQVENREKSDFTPVKESNVTLMGMDEINTAATNNNTKIRAKRQTGGAGKYTDAAKMPQVKLMRLLAQFFKNLWAPAYVGGAHPFHHEIPKIVVTLYKQKIVEFLVPDVGEDSKKPRV